MRIDAGPNDDIVAIVRGAAGDSVVVEIAAGRDALSLAMARAAIGPLAIERAPAMRVNAVVIGEGAAPAAIAAIAAFLDGAASTTGQVVEVN